MRDRDVRTAVLAYLDHLHAGDAGTRVVQEMGIWAGSVRVDIAVINGELHGFELKSERDTLERLPTQADLYSQVFDRVTLVVAEKHATKAVAIVPEWWGVLLASGSDVRGVGLHDDRQPVRNPAAIPVQIARLLWRAEALDVLDRHGLARGFRSRPVEILVQRMASEMPIDTLRDEVRAALKVRQGWLGQGTAQQRQMLVHANFHPVE
ncbi:sce7726 family protein [Methylobacterium sp. J-076]|uniref:sce7726 family protein n=1 Tax=Methylobacterium sp. J-076 TaxID=2836655 RepID=UPI001FBA5D90|nr:sce7726 family protein [Methylobacterium sp. J-076]MCJ2011797.1 sce7726 family protein [Methylobacterium sp. J-076]